VPHSRFNGLNAADLERNGYEILSHAGGAGVDMFLRRGAGLQLFLQGHPEYESDTLLRETCRDAGVPPPTEGVTVPAAWQPIAETIMRNFLGEVSLQARNGSGGGMASHAALRAEVRYA
jgi:homoserine O-succinyltransferase